jgi:ring-1,2-phenylacetyl-CoA epoxidase subunit PaaC
MQAGLEVVWPLVDELFLPCADPALDAVVAPADVDIVLDTVLATATLERPTSGPRAAVGGRTGRDGVHTEALGYVLAELQSIARSYPDAQW